MQEFATVTSIEYLDTEEDMYDITVEDDHSYLLGNGIVSHNSALALNIAINQAKMGARVSMTSLEMSRLENNQRILSNLTNIPMEDFARTHEMGKSTRRLIIDAWRDFNDRVHRNGGRFSVLCPDEDVSIEELLTLVRNRGYDNNIIDYMGLLKGMDSTDQWLKLGAAARYAKVYTRSEKCAITLLAQLGADGGIRYSKAIQEHASLMWTWMRADESGIITIKQPKSRNQRSFDFMLQQDLSVMRITDVDVSTLTSRKKEAADKTQDGKPRQARDYRQQKDTPKIEERTRKKLQPDDEYQL